MGANGIMLLGTLSGMGLAVGVYFYTNFILKKSNIKPVKLPILMITNGLAFLGIFSVYGWSLLGVLYSLFSTLLLSVSVIDWFTYEIPPEQNLCIGILGIIRLVTDLNHWYVYALGFFVISIFLYTIARISGKMGGGDVKLMAVAGLLLGWKLNVLGFLLGCILGSVIHLARMAVTKEKSMLAFGPYLAMGLYISALWGNTAIDWYFHTILGL